MRHSPDSIVRYDLALRRVYANPAFEALTGMTPDQYLGKTFAEASVLGAHHDAMNAALQTVLRTGATQEVEFCLTELPGQRVWQSCRIVLEKNERGQPTSVLSVARDITPHKRAQELLSQREREFRTLAENSPDNIARFDQQGRLVHANPAVSQAWGVDVADLVGKVPEEADRHSGLLAGVQASGGEQGEKRILAVMSHEIRTPLNGVIGMTEMLATTRLDPHQCRFVEAAWLSGRHLLELVSNLLDLAKIEANEIRLEREAVDLRELMREAAAPFVGMAAAKGLALETDIAADVPARIWSDPLRLRQVLVNLVGNAIKFTHAGRVRLSVTHTAPVQPSDRQLCLKIEVADSGIGIPQDALPHIFDAFTQADSSTARRYGGTGLGLAITDRLVRLMGAELRVDSEPGRGSRFHFVLPVDSATAEHDLKLGGSASEARPSTQASSVGCHLNVLVVEDSLVNQEVAGAMLAYCGVEAELVSDGFEALQRIATRDFDLVFMDCMMPGLDGYETVRRIRQLEAERPRSPALVIIALTANAGSSDLQQCMDAGMNDFLAKPLSLQSLRQALDRWRPAR